MARWPAGTDIILAETALASGAELDIVLPFATERFIETSVKIGDPPGRAGKWEKRFRAILDGSQGARSLTIMDPADPAERDLDGYFFYAFRYAAGCALQRAAMLQTGCRLVVVSDHAEPDSIAGANRVLADWREHGRPFDRHSLSACRAQRPAGRAGGRRRSAPWCSCGMRPRRQRRQGALDKLFNLGGQGARAHRPHPSRRPARHLPDRRLDRGGAGGRRGAAKAAREAKHSLQR